MNSKHSLSATVQDSWASAFVDGEASLSEQTDWSEAVHEQLYFYTLTRQVVRGETLAARHHAGFATHKATWIRFWAQVDSVDRP
jgi:hypothetical protein